MDDRVLDIKDDDSGFNCQTVILTADSPYDIINVFTDCDLRIEGEVKLKAIYIHNNVTICITGDSLTVINDENKMPAIGTVTHTKMSYGRWSVNQKEFTLKIDLKELDLSTTTPNFYVGCYGINKRYELGSFTEKYNTACECILPDARSDSTKMSASAVYVTKAEYEEIADNLFKELGDKVRSPIYYNFHSKETVDTLEKLLAQKFQNATCDFEDVACNDLKDISNSIAAVFSMLNRKDLLFYNKNSYDRDTIKEFFQYLVKKEMDFSQGVYKCFPVSARAYVAVSDRFSGFLAHSIYEYKVELQNLYSGLCLDDKSWEKYFGHIFKDKNFENRPCERFIWGVNILPTFNNDVTKDINLVCENVKDCGLKICLDSVNDDKAKPLAKMGLY